MRVNRAIEDGSFFENPALRGAFERGSRVHLLGLVSQGGVHSHIDHLRALLALRAREDVDPRVHRRPRRLAARGARRPRDAAAGPDRDRRRPLLRDGPRQALGADAARVRRAHRAATGTHARERARGGAGELRRRRHRRVHRAGRDRRHAADRARRQRRSSSTSAPTAARQLSRLLLDARRRPDDDDALQRGARLPGRLRGADRRRHARRGALASTGVRQLHVAETEKYAHVTYFFNGGVEEEWEGETRILVPSPRDVPSYDLKPEMSADEVADALLRRDRRRLRLRGRQLREPGHGRPHGRDPGRRRGRSRRPTAASAASSSRVDRARRRLPVTADHGNAEQLLEADGVSPHTAHTTNPVPLVVTAAGRRCATAASSPISRRLASICWGFPRRR